MSQRSPCSFCRENILRAHCSWDYHHQSYFSLKTSALRQCVFCTILLEDVQQHRPKLDSFTLTNNSAEQTVRQWLHGDMKKTGKLAPLHASPISLYRWSTRSLGRTREGKHSIAITFRVIPRPSGTDGDSQPQDEAMTFGLPERTFYCFPETDLEPLLIPADLGASTNPEANDGYQIKKWIRDCSINHKNCPKRAGAGKKWVPTRLLAIGGKREGESIRVVDTRSANIKGPYVTLSHCWGPSPEKRKDTLTAQSWKEFTSVGVPWSYLSNNFRQAIEVARFLEIDYIWIDSLCIIQGDVKDWMNEGTLMHKVYRNSYCNIAAADAANSKEGLFRKRVPQEVTPARFEGDGASPIFGRQKWRIMRADVWEHDLLSRPLYKRGWVFQERMLAPRILHFCQHQIFWDCAEISACESLPGGLPLPLDQLSSIDRHWRGRLQEGGSNSSLMLSATNDDSPEDFWKAAVAAYTSLDLTKQIDKRLAVWGIAKLVRDSLDEEYAVGMWSSFLEEQLAWKVADHAVSQRPEDLRVNPSWSWVSVNGRIVIQDRAGRWDRAYRVRNHEGQPLVFDTTGEMVRPKFPRQTSGDRDQDIANMSKDLELIDERRRKSSASSRHNSQPELPTSRHNSQVSMGRMNSDKGLLFAYERSSPRPTLRKAWSWKPINYSITTPKPTEPLLIYPFSAWCANVLRLVHRLITWLWCLTILGISALRPLISRTQCTRLTPNSGLKRSVPDSKDIEPELSDKKIAVQGYIHQAKLKWSSERGEYLLLPYIATEQQSQELIIEAYPDTAEDVKNETILYIVLALSRRSEKHGIIHLNSTPGLDAKIWYEGHGIMLRYSGVGEDYFRIGALHVRQLDVEMWRHMQTTSWKPNELPSNLDDWKGEKFWIV
ncbi:HET-domain-containing protein [Plenodomus tracheiphilus IPT5]|uniref:HET-domain-containing protein n=1 Tax=Plenodomus tracheiphilus IPT5 TaxID=1408161 RepID=A0A6A7BMH1_9PLEO|nr:HET-domain-containing protein [Plenodomus tracheiphilus IPT5]